MKVSDEMIAAGAHVLSEWFNDKAPIGEAFYNKPAEACFKAMVDVLEPAE